MFRRVTSGLVLALLAAGCGGTLPSSAGRSDGGSAETGTQQEPIRRSEAGGPITPVTDGGAAVPTDGGPAVTDGGGKPPTGDGRVGPPGAACMATLPGKQEPKPTTETDTCDWMDWSLSSDGYYFISEFGTSADKSTWGRGTSCGGLLTHYSNWCCMYDDHQKKCLDGQTPQFLKCSGWADPHVPKIPWVKGTVSYGYDTVVGRVKSYFFDAKGNLKPAADTMSFPNPEYFYVAGAQRFGCGATLRVTNTENGRCVVVYVEDGGPGSRYEQAPYAGRRIIDSSPAVGRYLGNTKSGWKTSTLLLVEWGLPGDRPGQPCTPCGSTAAKQGTESQRSIYDINHYENARGGVGCR
ncbi:MAG: hypothetical protein IT371_09265 [Deltaproteobacteria bacterium]|nr:hypothetical protein [Deltaproteobacteria bacterium]